MADETNPDLSASFMQQRDALATQTAIAEGERRVAARQPPPKPTPGAPAAPAAAAPAAPTQAPEGPTNFNAAGYAQEQGAAIAAAPLGTPAPSNEELGTSSAIAQDVGTGLAEIPRAAVTGVRDAVNNTIAMGDELGGWLEKKGIGGGIVFDHNGVHFASGEEMQDADLIRPADYMKIPHLMDDPKSITGSLIKGVVQFATGMGGASRALAAAGLAKVATQGGAIVSTVKAALSGFSAFDPHQDRLSNLVQQYPQISNPVTQFMASDPDDGDALGRLKGSLETVLGGVLTEGFAKSLSLLKTARTAQEALDVAASSGERAGAAKPADPLAVLGNPDAAPEEPLLQTQKPAEPSAAAPPPESAGGASSGPAAPGAELHPVTQRFADAIKNDPEGMRTAYAALPESQGGKVLNTDIARELSPDYNTSAETRSAHSANVHEPASDLVKAMYAEKLKEPPAEGQANMVLFTAGGTGAGKSTAIEGIPEVAKLADSAQIIYDNNFNNLASSQNKVEQALAAGKDVHIAYVYRDPTDALVNGALPRAMKTGRTVPLQAHAETHLGAFETVGKLQALYKDNPRVTFDVIDNSLGRGNAQLSSMEQLAGKRYNVPEEELRNALIAEHEAGRISDAVRAGTDSPAAGGDRQLPEGNRPVAGGQPQRGGPQGSAGAGGGAPDRVTPDQLAKPGEPAPPPKTFINFARIDTSADVQRAMQEIADAHQPGIGDAARGKQTFEAIKLNAQQRNAWKALAARRQGEPMSAEDSVAARQLWVASGEKLTQLASTASLDPSAANLFAFRKMVAVHAAIQEQVVAARTETARALASWRIPAGAGAQRLESMVNTLAENGGDGVAKVLAERINALARAGNYQAIDAAVEKGLYARTRDAVVEAWVNGLLSSPQTHLVNMTSNSIVLAMRVMERGVASKISSLLGDQGAVQAGEATAQLHGLMAGLPDAIRFSAKSLWTGESSLGLNKVEGPARAPAISSDALGMSSTGWLGRGVDLLGAGVRTPTRALTAEDEFFKSVGYRMELHAQALRQAMLEMHAGHIPEEGVPQRMADLIENPPENIKLAAVDSATYQTFTQAPGDFAKAVLSLTNRFPMLKLILPFVKTPANIMKFTFERTPLAPLMKTFQQNIAAGGARRDLALAQMGLGTMVQLATVDLALSGRISGSGTTEKGTKQAMQRDGWQPYSIKFGNRWYSFNRLDPLGSQLGMAADVVDSLRNMQHDALNEDDTQKLGVALALSLAGNVINKTYLSGLSSMFEAMSDPQQYGDKALNRLAGSFVPSIVAKSAQLEDPVQHQIYTMLDELKSRTPGVTNELAPKRDLWGKKMTYESGLGKPFDAFSPVYSKQPGDDPIDKELVRLDSNIQMPSAKVNIGGARVDLTQYPQAYSRYLELAGNALKNPAWNMGAKDYLNAVVSGQHPMSAVYNMRSDGPDGGKDVFIKDTVRQYRELAAKQIATEFPEVAGVANTKSAQQRALKFPVLN